jgi:hypothetical protein
MTLRYVRSAVAMVALACSGITGPAYAQLRDGGILPPGETGLVTVAGCLVRANQVRGGQDDKYVLANPRKGPVANVTASACTADPAANALTLDNPEGRINESMLGRWVEISGRLEKENTTNPDTLRELDVNSARLVTVAAPRAEAAPTAEPAPQAASPQPAAPPARDTAATSGRAAEGILPQTASYGPAGGLVGLMALAASLVLRTFRSTERG